MQTTLTTILVALVLASPTEVGADPRGTVAASPLALSIGLSADTSTTGDLIEFQVSLTNTGGAIVEVPDDTFKRISISGSYAAPGTTHSPVQPKAQPNQVSKKSGAEKIRWIKMAPGQRLVLSGTFRDVFEECLTGCYSGSYRLHAALAIPEREGMALAQGVASPSPGVAEVKVIPQRTARTPEGIEIHVSNPMWVAPTQLDFQGTVRNTGTEPIWIPTPDKLSVTCRVRIVTPVETVFLRVAPLSAVTSPYDERDGVLLYGGDEAYFSHSCRGITEQSILDAQKVFVGAEIVFNREFYPLKALDHADFLRGRTRSESRRVK